MGKKKHNSADPVIRRGRAIDAAARPAAPKGTIRLEDGSLASLVSTSFVPAEFPSRYVSAPTRGYDRAKERKQAARERNDAP